MLGQRGRTADDGFLFRNVEGDPPALGDVADEFGLEAAGVDVARIGEAGDAVGEDGGAGGIEAHVFQGARGLGVELEERGVKLLVGVIAGGGDAGDGVERDALRLSGDIAIHHEARIIVDAGRRALRTVAAIGLDGVKFIYAEGHSALEEFDEHAVFASGAGGRGDDGTVQIGADVDGVEVTGGVEKTAELDAEGESLGEETRYAADGAPREVAAAFVEVGFCLRWDRLAELPFLPSQE